MIASRWRLFLALAATVLPLPVLEVALRIHHRQVKVRSPYVHAENPSIGFVRRSHAWQGINALGFRDREHAIRKAEGVYRIVVAGDSVTAGYGLDPGEMYTERLEALLGAHHGGYEVVNFGMEQYSTVQELALFEELGLSMTPDLVIVAYVLNDPTRDGTINDFFERDRAASLVVAWLRVRAERLWVALMRRESVAGCRSFDYYSDLHCDARKWTAVGTAFRGLRDLSRSHGFGVLLVVFPLLDDAASFTDYRWRDVHRQVLAEASGNGFAILDLLSDFAQRSPSELQIAPGDRLHPNALGHEIAATAIYQTLLELGAGAGGTP